MLSASSFQVQSINQLSSVIPYQPVYLRRDLCPIILDTREIFMNFLHDSTIPAGTAKSSLCQTGILPQLTHMQIQHQILSSMVLTATVGGD